MSRTLTGTLLLPDGTPLPNAKIYLTAKRTEAASIVNGVNTFFTTNSSGAYSQSVVNGYYSVSLEFNIDGTGTSLRRWALGDIVVETAAVTTLEALLIATDPGESVEEMLLYSVLTDCQGYASAAAASAASAASSAASINPSSLVNISGAQTITGVKTFTQSILALTIQTSIAGTLYDVGNTGGAGNAQPLGIAMHDAGGWANRPSTMYSVVTFKCNSSNNRTFQLGAGTGGELFCRGLHSTIASPGWFEVWSNKNLASPMTLDTAQTVSGAKTFSAKITASAGVSLPSYTVATVPSASANTNVGIIVTNPTSGGRRPYWSDGANWYDAAHTLLA